MNHLLMIGMNFHTYEDEIVRCLGDLGFFVDKITDQPKRSHGYGLIPAKLREQDSIQFQKKQLQKLNKSYDIVLVFVGRFLHKFFLEELRKKNPNAKFILYLWDDLARVENYYEVKDCYDEIITFELKDALKLNLRFIPLYYMPDYCVQNNNKLYDICTVSSEHSDRIEIMRSLIQSNTDGMLFNFRIFALWKSYIKYILSGKKKIDESNGLFYTTKSATIPETSRLMSESRAILDIQHFTQKGLTNRTLEALGAKIKLVTTNEEVQYYDFYNPKNIYIMDRNNPQLDIGFLRSTYEEVPKDIYEKYSLRAWLEDILFNTKQYYLNIGWEEAKKLLIKD